MNLLTASIDVSMGGLIGYSAICKLSWYFRLRHSISFVTLVIVMRINSLLNAFYLLNVPLVDP